MKVYTALPGDQNPGNDTLGKNLGVQDGIVKKPVPFKVWPTLTRGIVNITSPRPVAIYDARGELIGKNGAGENRFTLNATGVYFVKSDGRVMKIVKVK